MTKNEFSFLLCYRSHRIDIRKSRTDTRKIATNSRMSRETGRSLSPSSVGLPVVRQIAPARSRYREARAHYSLSGSIRKVQVSREANEKQTPGYPFAFGPVGRLPLATCSGWLQQVAAADGLRCPWCAAPGPPNITWGTL